MVTAILFKFATIWTVVRVAYSRVEYVGSNITVVCNLSSVVYPRWGGPNNTGKTIVYNYLNSSTFNALLGTKLLRLSWNQNKRDITIQNLKVMDEGTYTCQDGKGNRIVQELNVRVRPNKPQIQGAENHVWRNIVRGTEDQDVSLTCISRGGYPEPFLDWYSTGTNPWDKLSSSKTKMQGNDSTFTVTVISNFNATRRHDRTSYICQSSYDEPSSRQSSSVVLYLSLRPTNPLIRGDVTVMETLNSTLKCESKNSRPEGNMSWTFKGHPSRTEFSSSYDNDSETFTMTSLYTTRTLNRQDNGGKVACKVGHEAIGTPLVTTATLNILFAPDAVDILGNQIVVANGINNLTLKCRISSANPVSNITWSGSGTPLSIISSVAMDGHYSGKIREEEVTFTPNRELDGKAISCTAKHYLLQSGMPLTKQVTLDLKYSPQVLITDASPKTVTEGESDITLHCSAKSKPASNFTWYQSDKKLIGSSGAQISNEFEYEISRANRSHFGAYKCCASNEVDSACSSDLHLQILFSPMDVQIFGLKIIAANGTNELELTCQAGLAYPVATVVWTIGSEQYTNGQISDTTGQHGGIIRNFTTTLKPTRHMDGTKIQCEAYNNASSHRAIKTELLNVNYGPDTTVLGDSPKIVVEGQSDITLTCFAESKPPSRFKWYKAGNSNPLLTGTGTSSSNRLSYTIATVNRTHTGNYSCIAENGITNTDNSDGEIQLIVQYPPDITVTTVNATIKDAYVDIHCTAAGVPANYTFSKWRQTWPGHNGYVRDRLVSTNGSRPSERTLRLTNLTYQDTGIYICEAGNGVNNRMMSGSSSLLVKSNPVLANISKAYQVPIGLNTQFRIAIAVYSNDGNITAKMVSNDTGEYVNASITIVDEPVIKLQVHGDEVNTDGYSLSVTHVITREDEFGNYTIYIANDFGATDVLLEVFAEGKPCPPWNLTITKRTSNSVTLSWIRCFHGGRQQTFVIQHSIDGFNWANGTTVEGGLSTSQHPLNTTIEYLQQSTLYYFMMFAYNSLGRSENTTVLNATTKAQVNGFVSEPNIGLIAGGGVGGLIAAVIVIVVVLWIFRRHKNSQGSPKKALLKENGRSNEADSQDDLPEINLNPMYDSAGPFPSTSKTIDAYAEVRKERSQQQTINLENTDVYAEVLKPKNKISASSQKTESSGGTSDVYSVPIKAQKDKQKKKEEKKQRKDKQTKSKKGKDGKVYENTDTFKQESEPKKSDNVYENPSCLTDDGEPYRTKNEDGLIYIAVELPKQKGMGDRKPVIHGLEDRTDYADIQFGEVGEPAPESDEEDNEMTNKQ